MTGAVSINVRTNFPAIQARIDAIGRQGPFATAVALNRTAEWAATGVRKEMRNVFDRPTPYFLQSLRVVRANVKTPPIQARVWFKDGAMYEPEGAMVLPHVFGGERSFKRFEARLRGIGILPSGWYALPGEAAPLDGFGNMSRGEISRLLNVLGTYTEAGFNKANINTVKRLAKGNEKKGQYGFVYWVNPVRARRAKHLPPGVYRRVKTAFGTSLKPILVFVQNVRYRKRLDFFGIVDRTVAQRFPGEFDRAFDLAMRTAKP